MTYIYDRPMWPPGAEITAQAFDAFQAWREMVDPDGDRSVLELVEEYGNCVGEKHLGENQ